MLQLNNIEVIYSDVILVLKGVSLEVPDGKIVALLGANGAGKTSTLKAISGVLRTEEGKGTDGNIVFNGRKIDHIDPEEIVRAGIVQVMEGRRLIEHLSVDENVRVGAYSRSDVSRVQIDLKRIYTDFPRLYELKDRVSGYLSGGERQLLVMARALMANPSLMLLDEPSLGLSPLMVREVFKIIEQINAEKGVSILLVEQNARIALSISDYAYVMEDGRIVVDGPSDVLRNNEDIREFYLGLSRVGSRKSYRDVKHYRRRKRWIA